MEQNVELLLQKYGISPKAPQGSNGFAKSSGSIRDAFDKTYTGLAPNGKNEKSEIELKIQLQASEIAELKAKLENLAIQREKDLGYKSFESENEGRRMFEKCRELEEQNLFLKSQLEVAEIERKRAIYRLEDRPDYATQCEILKQQLHVAQNEEKSLNQRMKSIQQENQVLREQLSHVQLCEQKLVEELRAIKKNSQGESKLLSSKLLISHEKNKSLKYDYKIAVQELVNENKKQKSTILEQVALIEELEKRNKELEYINKLSEDARGALKKQQQASDFLLQDVVSANEQLTETLRHDSLMKSKIKSPSRKRLKKSESLFSRASIQRSQKINLVPSYVKQDLKKITLRDKIRRLEDEISDTTLNYKNLMAVASENGPDYLRLKQKINDASKKIEEKGKNLLIAKRRYSNLLRDNSLSQTLN